MTIGIYKIENKINNKKYIGQSINIEKRWKEHQYLLNLNKHHNYHLQNAWNKYKEESFIFNIIEECDEKILNDKEQHWIEMLDSYNNGYNLDKGGEGTLGYKKGYYRVIKKGQDNENKRYQLLNPQSNPIVTSILVEELNYFCSLLNNDEITEEEVIILMKDETIQYRRNNKKLDYGYNLLQNLGINYLIMQSKNGYTKKDIMSFLDITQYFFDKFLEENNTSWYDIYDKADILKIKEYDNEKNIQQQLNNGKTVHNVCKEIGCTEKNFKNYREKHNIRKSHASYKRRLTNTGVRHVSQLSGGEYQYRRTNQNPNNITRVNFLDLKNVAKERNLEWIIDDNDKYLATLKKEKEK